MSQFSSPHLLNGPRWKNKRVGLLGGSFNPPHEGHVHISLAAMKGLHLDAIWWLVSPQNPIKSDTPLPLDERMKLCENLVDHPKILITDIEKEIGTTITYYTIKTLKKYYADTQFVWISGMDNALGLSSLASLAGFAQRNSDGASHSQSGALLGIGLPASYVWQTKACGNR